MDIRNILIKNNEELFAFTQTIQYELSRKIMKLRYEASFTEMEMAEALGISFSDYVALEYGDTNISEKEYLDIVISIQLIVINHLEESIEKTINEYFDFDISKDEFSEHYNYTGNQNKRSGFKLSSAELFSILPGAA